jgi:phage baseplate assembly protein W
MAGNPFLGKGLKFPINGKFVPESGTDLVIQDVQLLLLTNFGERVMRPEFGAGLGSRVWDNLETVAEIGIIDISAAINTYEPRVILLDVTPTVDRSRGLVYFHIRMIIRDGNVEANLVFPFKPISDISQR